MNRLKWNRLKWNRLKWIAALALFGAINAFLERGSIPLAKFVIPRLGPVICGSISKLPNTLCEIMPAALKVTHGAFARCINAQSIGFGALSVLVVSLGWAFLSGRLPLTPKVIALGLGLGVFWTFLLNALRISLVFGLGSFQGMANVLGTPWVAGLSFVIYLIGFYYFFSILRRSTLTH